jgi:hypothetical protein
VRARESLLRSIGLAGITADAAGWFADVERSVLRVLAETGGATTPELAALEPRLGTQVPVAVTRSRTALVSVAIRLMLILAAEGRVVRGRPQGSWTSARYRWCPIDQWLPHGMTDRAAADARADLLRRWLASYGPGTVADLKWWTGWRARDVTAALARTGAREVATDDGPAYLLPGDLDPVAPVPPWVALLPALDPTVMGWRDRDWYLGGYRSQLFDRNGNAGPTVWCDGRVVGGWAQRRSGEVVVRLLEDVGTEAAAAVSRAAGDLATLLGTVRVTPRFRTPLERELTR